MDGDGHFYDHTLKSRLRRILYSYCSLKDSYMEAGFGCCCCCGIIDYISPEGPDMAVIEWR